MSGRILPYAVSLLLVQLTAACWQQPAVEQQPARKEAATSNAVSAPPVEVADERLIVAFGDSLYAGYGVPQGSGFAPVLEQALEGQGISAHVINAGVSGDTTAGGRQRLDFVLDGLTRKPDLVILGLGANDMLRGLDVGEAQANLDAMLAELRDRQIDVVLTGMLATENMGRDYASKFNMIYPTLAKKYEVPLYPFFLDGIVAHTNFMLSDGLHPSREGIKEIVRRILPVIETAAKE
ncbi:MAG: arylesterase [Sphingomonadaceae bacterium]